MDDFHENDPGTEAEALSDWLEVAVEDDEDREVRLADERDRMRAAYQAARQAKVGSMIECPTCRREVRKRSYQQVFCSNKGRANCKDRYWNTVDDVRTARAREFDRR